MAKFGPEEFKLKNGKAVVIRHCNAEDGTLFESFHKKVSSETNHTLQIENNVPPLDKVIENWKATEESKINLRLGVFFENEIVGQLGFRALNADHPWIKHIGQFGMMVVQEFWGNGIGKRLIEIMEDHARSVEISKIETFVRIGNPRGVNLYLKNGYEIEGHRKNAAFINGAFCDEYSIAKNLIDEKASKTYPAIQTERLMIEPLFSQQAGQIIDYYKRNESHLEATDPKRSPEFYTKEYWNEKLSIALSEYQKESAVRLVMKDPSNHKIVGTINFSQIFRGPFQACYVGYGIDAKYEGQGLMSEALKASINFMFSEWNIHRVMANHLLDNHRSENLLAKLGFKKEGIAEKYLMINGEWRDHVLNSLSNSNWSDAKRP